MFKWIYTHQQYKIALTVFAEDKESSLEEIKTLLKKVNEMGVDLPPADKYEATHQIIL